MSLLEKLKEGITGFKLLYEYTCTNDNIFQNVDGELFQLKTLTIEISKQSGRGMLVVLYDKYGYMVECYDLYGINDKNNEWDNAMLNAFLGKIGLPREEFDRQHLRCKLMI